MFTWVSPRCSAKQGERSCLRKLPGLGPGSRFVLHSAWHRLPLQVFCLVALFGALCVCCRDSSLHAGALEHKAKHVALASSKETGSCCCSVCVGSGCIPVVEHTAGFLQSLLKHEGKFVSFFRLFLLSNVCSADLSEGGLVGFGFS